MIPSVLIIIWMKKRKKDDRLYQKNCNSAIIRGLVSVLPILVLSATFEIMNALVKTLLFPDIPELVYKVSYTFLVLAFVEEIVKFLCLFFLLKKKNDAYTWADVVAFMVIIGTAFGLIEDIPFAINSNAISILVRGFTMGHVSYAFLMGWFYGKRLYTGKKFYAFIAVLFPWLLHGIYDFSLTPELLEWSDNMAFIPFVMVFIDLVAIILMIRFFIRAGKKKDEKYHQPLMTPANSPKGEEPST